MNLRAAGSRSLDLELLLREGDRRMREPRIIEAWRTFELVAGRTPRRCDCRLAGNAPVTWQARMRSSSITGVWLASDSSKPFSTHAHDVRQIGPRIEQPHRDFIAKACERSWMIDEPSP